ncbi:MAG: hypothetical protein P4L96_07085 [Rhodoferax sp.]|jgi:hypothetical protein|nr:hypothetical protein [Rhodoferax sp.]
MRTHRYEELKALFEAARSGHLDGKFVDKVTKVVHLPLTKNGGARDVPLAELRRDDPNALELKGHGHASAKQDGSNGPAPVRLIHRNTNTVH